MTDTTTVTFHVLGVEPVRSAGRLIGLAIVRLEIAGVELTLQGVRVERGGSGIGVHAPAFRHPSNGRSVSAVLLPPELRDAIGAEVLAAIDSGTLA